MHDETSVDDAPDADRSVGSFGSPPRLRPDGQPDDGCSQAHAAYGPCDTTSWRDVAHLGGTTNEYKIPARTGNGLSCYMGYRQGPRAAVEALQVAIIICYGGPPAQMIYNSGGADGYYGSGTVDAVKWLQINKLGLSGSADGVYGPQTRSRMEWPHYYERGAILYSCSNPPAF